MRLGQLARKLTVRPSDIIEFLKGQAILTEEGTNTKLTDDHVKMIIDQFAPDQLAAILNADPAPETIESAAVTQEPEITEVEPVTETVPEIISEQTPEIQPEKTEGVEKIEVIKAPKVELSGLKVLGKIELPQPKKKEVPTENTEVNPENEKPAPTDRRPPRENRKNFNQQKDRRDFKPRKNPIALQREREAREAEEKKREEAKQKKEQRTNYYLERVKPAAPTKPARLYDEPVLEMKDHQAKAQKQPTTWLGKFWKWYTS